MCNVMSTRNVMATGVHGLWKDVAPLVVSAAATAQERSTLRRRSSILKACSDFDALKQELGSKGTYGRCVAAARVADRRHSYQHASPA